jgi:hypothetical protein
MEALKRNVSWKEKSRKNVDGDLLNCCQHYVFQSIQLHQSTHSFFWLKTFQLNIIIEFD